MGGELRWGTELQVLSPLPGDFHIFALINLMDILAQIFFKLHNKGMHLHFHFLNSEKEGRILEPH